MFYTAPMSKLAPRPPPATLTVKIGAWFEATATGRGILAVPLVVLMLVITAIVRWVAT
jgi:hypothetical protein